MALKDVSILVVEDAFSLELEMLLNDIGYQSVVSVDNSAEAIEHIYTAHPDLILMGVEIKGRFSGLQVAEQVKHLEIPILFINRLRPLESFSLRSSIERAIEERYIYNR